MNPMRILAIFYVRQRQAKGYKLRAAASLARPRRKEVRALLHELA